MAVIGSNARGSVDRLLSLTLQGIHYVPRAGRVPAQPCDYSHVSLRHNQHVKKRNGAVCANRGVYPQ
jgi:hypothetical protein